jgi:short-subunit dehydrogenase
MKTAVIIGASSGIGRALAVALSLDGYRLGVAARRTDLLAQLREELAGPCIIKTIDVSQPDLAMPLLRELIGELGDVELFVVNAGTGSNNAALAWEPERETIEVILEAIHGRRDHVYVTRRWRLIAWLMRLMPGALYARL